MIELSIAVAVLILFYAFFRHKRNKDPLRSKFAAKTPNTKSALASHQTLLLNRWESPAREMLSASAAWREEAVTANQLSRLKADGFHVLNPRLITRGMASDVIGSVSPLDDEDERILQFFNRKTVNLSETEGRDKVFRLLSDSANKARWDSGPASEIELYVYALLNGPSAENLCSKDANDHIVQHANALPHPLAEVLKSIDLLWRRIETEESRRRVGIRKPTPEAFIDAAIEIVTSPDYPQRQLNLEETIITLIRTRIRKLPPE